MNAPMTKFAIMRANRGKQTQTAIYGQILNEANREFLRSTAKIARHPLVVQPFQQKAPA